MFTADIYEIKKKKVHIEMKNVAKDINVQKDVGWGKKK